VRKLLARLRAVPHLFGKVVVIWCVACGTAASAWALRILSRTGHDPAGLLGVILAFFGGELMIMCLRKALAEKGRGEDETEE